MNLQPGDPYATKASPFLGLFLHLLKPYTDRWHWGLILMKRGEEYIVIESDVTKGVHICPLSQIKGELEFYRVNCPREQRLQAPWELVKYGKAQYDHLLPLKLFLGYLVAFIKLRRRPKVEEIPYARNSQLVCTEAVILAYSLAGFEIVPKGVAPIPNALKQAELEGKLTKIPISDAERR